MDRQINIIISEATMQLIEEKIPQENLNQLINKALNFYIKQNLSENLKQELLTPASKGSGYQETSINHDSVIADILNQK